jgi:hypothetical protein
MPVFILITGVPGLISNSLNEPGDKFDCEINVEE